MERTGLRGRIGGIGAPLAAAAAFSAGINLLVLTGPLYMMQVFDRVLTGHSLETLVFLTLLAVLALVTMALLDAARARVMNRLGGFVEARLAPEVLQRSVAAGLFGVRSSGEGLRDLAQLRQAFGGGAATALFDLPWVPLLFLATFLVHPLLGGVALAGAVLLVLLALGNEWLIRGPLQRAAEQGRSAQRLADAAARNADTIDAMGMLPALAGRWRRYASASADEAERAAARNGDLLAATRALRMLLQIGVLGCGAALALAGDVSAGAAIAAATIVSRALAPVETAMAGWKQLVQARAAGARLARLLAARGLRADAMPLPRPKGALAVEGVSFAPPGSDRPLLRQVTFAAVPGELIAVLGPSGAGKSTLARLLVGTLAPAAGLVRLDGADLHAADRAVVGPAIGYLPQDIELFEGSVAENIARLQAVEPAAVVAAAEAAAAQAMILRLPQGYDTPVGPGGVALSGGQRQRIALARALYGDPQLIVLDEPNAHLDVEGEAALAEALQRAVRRGATVVAMTHRPALLEAADKILVLNDGRVELFGPRAEVLSRLAQRRRPAAAPTLRAVPQETRA